jgi:hypothetical protein
VEHVKAIVTGLAAALPRLSTRIQLSGFALTVGAGIVWAGLGTNHDMVIIPIALIGVLLLVFGQLFQYLLDVKEEQRASLILKMFGMFCGLATVLVVVSGAFLWQELKLPKTNPADANVVRLKGLGEQVHALYEKWKQTKAANSKKEWDGIQIAERAEALSDELDRVQENTLSEPSLAVSKHLYGAMTASYAGGIYALYPDYQDDAGTMAQATMKRADQGLALIQSIREHAAKNEPVYQAALNWVEAAPNAEDLLMWYRAKGTALSWVTGKTDYAEAKVWVSDVAKRFRSSDPPQDDPFMSLVLAKRKVRDEVSQSGLKTQADPIGKHNRPNQGGSVYQTINTNFDGSSVELLNVSRSSDPPRDPNGKRNRSGDSPDPNGKRRRLGLG